MLLDQFLVRLFITIGVVWLTQVILSALKIKEPASNIIFIVVLLIMLVFLVIGSRFMV